MAHLQDAPIMPVQIRAVKMRFFKRLQNQHFVTPQTWTWEMAPSNRILFFNQ